MNLHVAIPIKMFFTLFSLSIIRREFDYIYLEDNHIKHDLHVPLKSLFKFILINISISFLISFRTEDLFNCPRFSLVLLIINST